MLLKRRNNIKESRISGHIFIYIVVLISLVITNVTTVQITRLSVPPWVQNGTEESVVLDCEYTITRADERLVVKWFLNDDPEPIYQWIPELNSRHASRRLQGRLNMGYTVSPSNGYTKYRALNILRPTTDLSGRYSCHVVSLGNQDSKDQTMIVYAPPQFFDFNFTKFASGVTKLTCEADRVYPMPKLSMSRRTPEDDNPRPIVSAQTVLPQNNGAFTIQITREIRDRELPSNGPTIFECSLDIPGTDYRTQRQMIYYPGIGDANQAVASASYGLLLTCLSAALVYLVS